MLNKLFTKRCHFLSFFFWSKADSIKRAEQTFFTSINIKAAQSKQHSQNQSLLAELSPSENPFFAGVGRWFLILSWWDLVRKAIIIIIIQHFNAHNLSQPHPAAQGCAKRSCCVHQIFKLKCKDFCEQKDCLVILCSSGRAENSTAAAADGEEGEGMHGKG